MIEVFFCTMPLSERRKTLASQMLAWWKDRQICDVKVVTPEVVGCDPCEFQRERRIYAESMAGANYILTDDDCELVSPKMIWNGFETLDNNNDFAMVSAYPLNANINPWTPEIYEPRTSAEVMEHVSVGGIRFVRIGAMTKGWPPLRSIGYDADHCQRIRECRFRSGYAMKVQMIHHGEGHSDIWHGHSLDTLSLK